MSDIYALHSPGHSEAIEGVRAVAEHGLSALLTVEGLLLASLAVMASLSAPTLTGRPLPTRAHTAAVVVAFAISVVAIGAGVSVKRLFICSPRDADLWVAVPLLAGIVVQPAFAWWIAKSLRGS